MAAKDIILDIRENCECRKIKYCPLEKFVERMPARLFEQHKCIEILKWDKQLSDNDEGWRKAYEIWVEEGYAKAFGDVYLDGMKHKELISEVYRRISAAKN